MRNYDMNLPWNSPVRGTQVLPLINEDGACFRVEAGPGTGKTFGLEQRVFRLLHPQGGAVPSKSVLVVAFNRVIAHDLRSRIQKRLEVLDRTVALPVIATLHSFCLDQLGLHYRILLPHEQDAMGYDLATACPQILEKHVDHDGVMKALRLLQANQLKDDLLSDQSQKWLLRHKANDIGDVPLQLLIRIKGGDYSDLRFDHVVVDEFQDLTATEQELVFRLVRQGGTIVALGDPRQSIYAFRGNSRDGLSELEQRTSESVTDIPLTDCQRCPNKFVDLANAVMISSRSARLQYGNPGKDNTHLVYWKTPGSEAKGMAKAITENIHAKPEDDHLAITTRRVFGTRLRDELLKIDPNVQVRMVYSESPLDTWPVREAFIAFCLLTDPDGPTWRSWFAYKNRLRSTAPKEELATRRNSPAYLDLLQKTGDNITMSTMKSIVDNVLILSGVGMDAICARAQRILSIEQTYGGYLSDPSTFIDKVLAPSSWTPWLPDDATTVANDFNVLAKLAYEILEEENVGAAADRLRNVSRKLRAHVAARDTNCSLPGKPDITIATLWSAKGVTADHVYVLGLCDEAIPGERRPEYPGTDADHYDEQQRLFYVTVTRSKFTLVLSRAKRVLRTQSESLGLGSKPGTSHYADLRMCRFLGNIIGNLPTAVDGSSWKGCV